MLQKRISNLQPQLQTHPRCIWGSNHENHSEVMMPSHSFSRINVSWATYNNFFCLSRTIFWFAKQPCRIIVSNILKSHNNHQQWCGYVLILFVYLNSSFNFQPATCFDPLYYHLFDHSIHAFIHFFPPRCHYYVHFISLWSFFLMTWSSLIFSFASFDDKLPL